MTNCSRCASENLEDAKFCASCGGRLEPALVLVHAQAAPPEFPAMRGMAPAEAPVREEHHLPMRGMVEAVVAKLEPAHAVMRGAAFASVAPANTGAHFASGKNPGVAIVLSVFFPGGGQFYNGDTNKGLVLLATAIMAYCLTVYVGAWFLGMPLTLGSWVWSFLDAGKVARQQKALW